MPRRRSWLREEPWTKDETLALAVPNNSGTGEPAPPEVRRLGFCWGAAMFPWWFAVANHIPRGCFLQVWLPSGDIWFAQSAHELAWLYRRFASWEEYVRTMRAWNVWGLRWVWFGGGIGIAALVVAIVLWGLTAVSR